METLLLRLHDLLWGVVMGWPEAVVLVSFFVMMGFVAWTLNKCLTCPLGELAALAAATLVFYQEQQKGRLDHWSNYRVKS